MFSSVGVGDKEEKCKSHVAISFLPPSFPVDPLPSPGFQTHKARSHSVIPLLIGSFTEEYAQQQAVIQTNTTHRPQQVEVA